MSTTQEKEEIYENMQASALDLADVEKQKDKVLSLGVLVVGLEDFSSWLDLLNPAEISEILNLYFESIGEPVQVYGGFIDKYLGDGFIAVFGFDNKLCGHPAAHAVLAALQISEKIKVFNEFLFKKYGREFSIGIGIDWGEVVVGNIGFRERKEITAIGRPVSRARSIEKLTRSVDSCILASEAVHKEIDSLFHWGENFKAKLRKENRSIQVLQPIALIRRRYKGGVKIEEY